MRDPNNLRPYLWPIRLSFAFVILLGIAVIGGHLFLWVQDRSAQTVC